MGMTRKIGEVLLVMVLTAIAGAVSADQEADTVIRSMENRTRAETNTAIYKMIMVRANEGDREVRMQSWDDRAGDRSFIHILSPRRDRDTTFLRVEKNLWMYLPNLERDIKIPPAMMLNSWMGSDFTNDDLVNASSAVDDYENIILGREIGADGIEIVTIESIAHQDAPVVWGRVVAKIRMDGIPVSQHFYDEDGILIRSLTFSDVRDFGGRLAPARMEMVPENEVGRSSVLVIEEMTFDEPIPDEVFTRANLSRRAR